MDDEKSVYKVYFVSIVGRDSPAAYEWAHCELSMDGFLKALTARGPEGIGFVIAFPHITKIYRWGPSMETVLDVAELSTSGLELKDCSREDEYHEFACYAEAAIAAEEYHTWARARTVAEYLDHSLKTGDYPIDYHAKLAAYWPD